MANYTINEIPDTASEVGNADLTVVWQNNATKKISILNFFKNLVKKSEVTNTVSVTSESVITSKGVSSLLTIPASNTTITNAPPLQNNATYRFFFTDQITGSDDTSAMSISYNGTSYSVKATANGSLKNFTAYPIATEQTRNLAKGEKTEEEKGETKSGTRATVTTYVYCQAYTTLEMMFDGTQFIIMGNPVVISNSDYTVYTDGLITYTKSHIDKHNCYIFYVDNYTERGNKFCGVIEPNTTIERAFTDFARNGNYYYFLQTQAFNETSGLTNTCDRLTTTNVTYPLGNNAEIQIDRTNNVVRFVNNTAYPLQLSFEVIYSR